MEIVSSVIEIMTILLALVGVMVSIIGLPGTWIVFGSILIWSWVNSFAIVTWQWLLLFLTITIISSFIDNLAILFGAKKYGASGWGIFGSIVGLIIGALVANIPGLILGAFLGAVVTEMLFTSKSRDEAMKAGFGALVGFVFGNLLKMLIALSMIFGWWLIAT